MSAVLDAAAILADLARVKALFQLRAIATVMGIDPNHIDTPIADAPEPSV